MPIKSAPKMVDASEVPRGAPGSRGTPTPTKVWVERLLHIPPGKALVYENETAATYATKSGLVRSYIKRGLIPDEYYVTRRKTGENRYTVYIAHEAKEANE